MIVGKLVKWASSTVRVLCAKARLGSRLVLPREGRPPYLGRGVRLRVAQGGRLTLGSGSSIDDYSRLQVLDGAEMSLGPGVYLNTNCRLVAAKRVTVGEGTFLGPNVCVFDHDHVFDSAGVRSELVSSPIAIGSHCWIAANVLVTRGVTVADAILIGGVCRYGLS